jgi:hypothetical protein
VGLVGLTYLGAMRRRSDLAAATALALVLWVALGVVTASFPNTPSTVFSYSYASWWAAPVGMWTWMAVGWSMATLWSSPRRRRPIRRAGPGTALALGAVVAVGAVVASRQGPDSQEGEYGVTRSVVQRLDAKLPRPRTVRVESSTFAFRTAVTQALRRRGAIVGTDEGAA